VNKLSIFALVIGASLLTAAAEEKKENNLKIGGSLRYRHEMILKEDEDSQNRHRVSAKAAIKAKINKDFKAGIELASGGKTATSSNQTLDDSFTKKEIRLNQANISFKCPLTGIEVTGGKLKAPFEKVSKAELVWDSDIVPEGIAIKYDNEYPSKIRAFLNAGGFWLNEHSGDTDDFMMFAGQGGAKIPLTDILSVKIAVGAYYYNSVNQGIPEKDGAGNNSTKTIVNSEGDSLDIYISDYTPVEAMAEIGMKTGTLPITVFWHYVQNVEVDDDNKGWLAGVSIGKVKKPGSFALRAYYRELQKEAVFGAFGDSDFGGGSTDNKGVELNAGVGIANNVSGAATYFINQQGIDDGKSYHRGQFDVKVKF